MLEVMREYNKKLARFRRMEKWLRQADREEQKRFEQDIVQVIEDCNTALNAVRQYREVTMAEVAKGFELREQVAGIE